MGFDFVNGISPSALTASFVGSGVVLSSPTLASPALTSASFSGTSTANGTGSFTGTIVTGSLKIYVNSGLITSYSLQ